MVKEWEQVRAAMLPAIGETRGTHTEDDVVAGVLTNKLKLWRRGASGLITEFVGFPQMKTQNSFLTGGDLSELLPLMEPVQNHAIANGCRRLTCMVAKGENAWMRVLGDGWRRGGVFLYKDM